MGQTPAILLIGCGKMGSALAAGWRAAGVAGRIVAVDPSPPADLPDGIEVVPDPGQLPAGLRPDAVVVAVKPQKLDSVLPAYRGLADDCLVVSIVAGKPVAAFRRHLGEGARIVRAMPNTPASIGRGITVGVAGPGVDAADRDLCDRLLAAVGQVAWLEDEGLLDAVTAVSGSGPAYVFLLVESLAKAAAAAGLPEDLAQRLARATVAGAGEMLHRLDESPDTLRRNVTSPGGTTQAALEVLMAPDGLDPLLERAVAAGTRRSRDLAG